jgi:hypothetical protein
MDRFFRITNVIAWIGLAVTVVVLSMVVYSCANQADYECIAEYEADGEC